MTGLAEPLANGSLLGNESGDGIAARLASAPGTAFRRAALESFHARGVPTRHVEEWKYTDVAFLNGTAYTLAESAAGPWAAVAPLVDAFQITLVNGFVVAAAEGLPAGVTLHRFGGEGAAAAGGGLGQSLPYSGKPFAALNTALFADGIELRVGAGVALEKPVELVSIGRGDKQQFHPRVLVVLEEGASATLVERHQGTGGYFANVVVELSVAANASLRHYKVQDDDHTAIHLSTTGLTLAEQGRYEGLVLQLGSRLSRHEVHVGLDGQHASFQLGGAYVGSGNQHLDNTTFVNHRAPGCASNQVFKGVLDDAARGVFQGSVLVEREAQKTDAHQLSKALLLSPRAEMDGKPELEIYADDVKCGHGATIGELDETALFYLQSRGIDEEAARQLLIEAFVAEVMEQVSVQPLREALAGLVGERLRATARRG